jgi:hypothetical protein
MTEKVFFFYLSCEPIFRKNIDRRREKFGYESVSNMGLSVAGADVFQVHTLIKMKTKFSSYVRKSWRDRLQSHI